MRGWIVGALTVCLVSLSATPARAETIDEIEKAIGQKIDKLKSVRYTSVTDQSLEYPGVKSRSKYESRMEMLRKGTGWLTRIESRMHTDTDANGVVSKQEHSSLSVYDGTTLWTLQDLGGAKQCTRQTPGPQALDAFDLKKQFEQAREMFTIKVLPGEKVDGNDCWVVEMSPKAGAAGEAGATGRTVNYYDKATGMAIKSVSYDKDGKPISTSVIRDLAIDADISPERFAFKPPDGVPVMDMDELMKKSGATDSGPSKP